MFFNRYQRFIFGAFILGVTTNVIATPAQDLERVLTAVSTLKADFQQTVYSDKQKLVQQASGNMEFKRPDMFRWQILQPDKSLVVTDGNKLWNYDVDLEQVTVQPFTQSKEVSPVSFLFDDINELQTKFTIQNSKADCYKLTPKQSGGGFVNVEVCFKQANIKSLQLLDHLGQTSKFEFSHVQNNPKIATERFMFTPPAGVDVIGEL